MLSGLFVGDDNNQFRDFAPRHPFVQLRHDLLDIRLDLIIGRDCCHVREASEKRLKRNELAFKELGVAVVPSMLSPYFLTLDPELEMCSHFEPSLH